MSASRWHFQSLERTHLTDDFCSRENDTDEPSLDEYIKRFALTNHRKGTARAYVAVRPDSRTVWAYYTLSACELALDALAEDQRRGLPRTVPGTLLGRMAVHTDYQGNDVEKLGWLTLQNALARAELAARTVGSFFVLVDPVSRRARDFYVRAGFSEVPGKPERLLYPISEIRKLGLPPPE